jgi:hypothetical protein
MAEACGRRKCVCGRKKQCGTLMHTPLVWTDSLDTTSIDWHVRKIEVVKALYQVTIDRNVVLCGIELITVGPPRPAPAIGDAACIFVSGSRTDPLAVAIRNVAGLQRIAHYGIRFAYTDEETSRQRTHRLLPWRWRLLPHCSAQFGVCCSLTLPW